MAGWLKSCRNTVINVIMFFHKCEVFLKLFINWHLRRCISGEHIKKGLVPNAQNMLSTSANRHLCRKQDGSSPVPVIFLRQLKYLQLLCTSLSFEDD